MSESFQSALEKVNYGKYIDQIQEELKMIIAQVGPGKNSKEVEATQERLQALIRTQSKELAKEVGFRGDHVTIFMTATAIIATAWVSFALRRETSDMSKSPEDRLANIEMFDALELALGKVIQAASGYADRYPGTPAAGAPQDQQTETRT
jgi:hypothetical protein